MRSESEKEEVDRMSQQNIEIDTKPGRAEGNSDESLWRFTNSK